MTQGQCLLADEAVTLVVATILGREVAALLAEPGLEYPGRALMLHLHGDLGAGKTTFSRGVIRALGHEGAVKSPTYTLVEPYEHLKFPVYHFDLYRLADPEEVDFLGVESYFVTPGLCLVEWPDRGAGVLPAADLVLSLSDHNRGRNLQWQSTSGVGEILASRFARALAAEGY